MILEIIFCIVQVVVIRLDWERNVIILVCGGIGVIGGRFFVVYFV